MKLTAKDIVENLPKEHATAALEELAAIEASTIGRGWITGKHGEGSRYFTTGAVAESVGEKIANYWRQIHE